MFSFLIIVVGFCIWLVCLRIQTVKLFFLPSIEESANYFIVLTLARYSPSVCLTDILCKRYTVRLENLSLGVCGDRFCNFSRQLTTNLTVFKVVSLCG